MKTIKWNEEFILSAYFHNENQEKVRSMLNLLNIDFAVKKVENAPNLVCFEILTTYREAAKLHPLLTGI